MKMRPNISISLAALALGATLAAAPAFAQQTGGPSSTDFSMTNPNSSPAGVQPTAQPNRGTQGVYNYAPQGNRGPQNAQGQQQGVGGPSSTDFSMTNPNSPPPSR